MSGSLTRHVAGEALNLQMGAGGAALLADGDEYVKDETHPRYVGIITAMSDTTFTTLTDPSEDFAGFVTNSWTLPQGMSLYGTFTDVKVAAGKVICYLYR